MKPLADNTSPNTESFTVARRYLTEREVEKLMDTARKHSRRGHRDATMILVAYRHGLRASEVCDLQWQQVELDQGRLHVRRAKRGTPSVHPILGDEIRAQVTARKPYGGLYLRFRAWRAYEYLRLPPSQPKAWQSRQDAIPDPPAHATARLRLQAGQRRSRYPRPAALSRAQEYPAHGAIH
jgi:integrase